MQLIQSLTLTDMADRVERICTVVEGHFLADQMVPGADADADADAERQLLPDVATGTAHAAGAVAWLGGARGAGSGAFKGPQQPDEIPSPAPLVEALGTLFQVLLRFESDWQSHRHSISAGELSELGDQGQQLLDDLLQWHEQLKLSEGAAALRDLAVPFSLWLVAHGAQLIQLETLVNQLADLANSSQDQQALAELDGVVGVLIDGIDPSAQRDLDSGNPQRPWRVLLLNHAIVATRTHDAQRMIAAFERLVTHLPDDAPAFFAQGMGQLDSVDYPPAVRDVMERYYLMWNTSTLH